MSSKKSVPIYLVVMLFLLPLAFNGALIASANGVGLGLKVYTKNIFGWELTSVTTWAVGDLKYCSGEFDTFSSYTRREAKAAWWCITCYAEVTYKIPYVGTYLVMEETGWKQGSWNVEYRGSNIVKLKADGGCNVRELAYYNLDGTTNKVLDSIVAAFDWIWDKVKDVIGTI